MPAYGEGVVQATISHRRPGDIVRKQFSVPVEGEKVAVRGYRGEVAQQNVTIVVERGTVLTRKVGSTEDSVKSQGRQHSERRIQISPLESRCRVTATARKVNLNVLLMEKTAGSVMKFGNKTVPKGLVCGGRLFLSLQRSRGAYVLRKKRPLARVHVKRYCTYANCLREEGLAINCFQLILDRRWLNGKTDGGARKGVRGFACGRRNKKQETLAMGGGQISCTARAGQGAEVGLYGVQ